jgi:hypothetical protein
MREDRTKDQNIDQNIESYPEPVEGLSAKWRSLQQEGRARGEDLTGPERGSLPARHYVPFGIGIGVLVIALLIVFGGLAFLVWNGAR